ncbi:DUF4064 domain-containing protein [Candidatus Poseidoniales archaeon]|nr:DUF4064 domain-containing protein [Candidatus Poseidoniales archaeon]MDB2542028.1 DUF4064 domain-containing protein [Candidatus Poseidoniales archaeon]
MVGELSEDGNWIWDGDNWVPHATEEASPQMNEPSELVVEPSGSVGTLPVPSPEFNSPLNPVLVTNPAFNPLMTPIEESNTPKILKIISGSFGILMSVVLLLFILGLVVGVNSDNISYYQNEGSSSASDYADAIGVVQILTYIQVIFVFGILIASIMTILDKTAWWVLPALITVLIFIFAGTSYYLADAGNVYLDSCDPTFYDNCGDIQEESMFDQDHMLSGYGGLFGLSIIGILSLIIKAKSSNKNDGALEVAANGGTSKAANRTLAISIVVIVIGALFAFMVFNALMNPVTEDSNESSPTLQQFVGRDMDVGADLSGDVAEPLVAVDLEWADPNSNTKNGGPIRWDLLKVEITIDGTDYTCSMSNSLSDCVVDKMETNDDGYWSQGESILFYEGSDSNLCSDTCTVEILLLITDSTNPDRVLKQLDVVAQSDY